MPYDHLHRFVKADLLDHDALELHVRTTHGKDTSRVEPGDVVTLAAMHQLAHALGDRLSEHDPRTQQLPRDEEKRLLFPFRYGAGERLRELLRQGRPGIESWEERQGEGMTQDMTDAEFLRSVAHAGEIGDPMEERDVTRLRELAYRVESIGMIGGAQDSIVFDDVSSFGRGMLQIWTWKAKPPTDRELEHWLLENGIRYGHDARANVATALHVLFGIEVRG